MTHISLTQEERTTLLKFRDAQKDIKVFKRVQCIILSNDGYTTSSLTAILNVERRTIYNWFRKWRENKSPEVFLEVPKSGRPPKVEKKSS